MRGLMIKLSARQAALRFRLSAKKDALNMKLATFREKLSRKFNPLKFTFGEATPDIVVAHCEVNSRQGVGILFGDVKRLNV